MKPAYNREKHFCYLRQELNVWRNNQTCTAEPKHSVGPHTSSSSAIHFHLVLPNLFSLCISVAALATSKWSQFRLTQHVILENVPATGTSPVHLKDRQDQDQMLELTLKAWNPIKCFFGFFGFFMAKRPWTEQLYVLAGRNTSKRAEALNDRPMHVWVPQLADQSAEKYRASRLLEKQMHVILKVIIIIIIKS